MFKAVLSSAIVVAAQAVSLDLASSSQAAAQTEAETEVGCTLDLTSETSENWDMGCILCRMGLEHMHGEKMVAAKKLPKEAEDIECLLCAMGVKHRHDGKKMEGRKKKRAAECALCNMRVKHWHGDVKVKFD